MNILYCGDRQMQDGVLISTLSLLDTVAEPLHVYILTAKIQTPKKTYEPFSTQKAAELNGIVQKHDQRSRVTKIDITEQFASQPPIANMNSLFTPNCMLRLYADEVAELPDRILYLDADVICRRDCSAFYHQNLRNVEMVGVLDHYGKWFFRNPLKKFSYLNSGVLLLNLKVIRDNGLFADARYLCQVHKMFMPDQTALNKLAAEKEIAPTRFNEQKKLKSDTVFQHFTTSFRFFPWVHTQTVKPWQIDRMHTVLKLHEYDDLLDQYQSIKKTF